MLAWARRGIRGLASSAAAGQQQQQVKLPVQLYGLEARYANALFAAATKSNSLPAVQADLQAIQGWKNESPQFKEFVENPVISKADKRADVLKISKGMNETTRGLLSILAENGRLNALGKIAETFDELMRAKNGVVRATVITAESLPPKQVKNIERALHSGYMQKNQTLDLSVEVKPEILGGLQVKIGDKFLDLSIQSQINNVYKTLI